MIMLCCAVEGRRTNGTSEITSERMIATDKQHLSICTESQLIWYCADCHSNDSRAVYNIYASLLTREEREQRRKKKRQSQKSGVVLCVFDSWQYFFSTYHTLWCELARYNTHVVLDTFILWSRMRQSQCDVANFGITILKYKF